MTICIVCLVQNNQENGVQMLGNKLCNQQDQSGSFFFDRDYSRVCAYNLHTRANDCSEDTINLPGLVYVCKN